MNSVEFEKIINNQFNRCKELLGVKNAEYTPKEDDRLSHFKKAAVLIGGSPKAALLGMLSKHLISIADMCISGTYTRARWDEKITDSINYLLLLKALVEEENEQDTDSNSKSASN